MAISDFIIGNEDLNSPVSIIDNLEDIRATFSLLTEKSWNRNLDSRGVITSFKADTAPDSHADFLCLPVLFTGGSACLYKTRKGKSKRGFFECRYDPPASLGNRHKKIQG